MAHLASQAGLCPEDRPEQSLVLSCPPTPLRQAELVRLAPAAVACLGESVETLSSPEWASLLAGAARLPDGWVQPYATAYSGHQFGVAVPRLGDGRALHLGCYKGWELQLKGAGPTPFRRGADGRAVLRSSFREFLASEYMASMEVPTTRALSLVLSPGPIFREQAEPAGVVCRMAPAFWRFGHLEWMERHADSESLDRFLDLLCRSQEGFEEAARAPAGVARREALLREVAYRTGRLMGLWMAEGFVHGVMNTDNLSLLGLTLDYGPYGYLERLQPQQVYNHSDGGGRYRYDQQPLAALWSLFRLANALQLPSLAGLSEETLAGWFESGLDQGFEGRMALKLGLAEGPSTRPLIDRLYRLAARGQWRLPALLRRMALEDLPAEQRQAADWAEGLRELGPLPEWADEEFQAWRLDHLRAMTGRDRLAAVPAVMPWNWILEVVIRAAEDHGDLQPFDRALALWSAPQTALSGYGEWAGAAPGWSETLELSCSS